MTRLLRVCLLAIACGSPLAACSKQDVTGPDAPGSVDKAAPAAVPVIAPPAQDVPALLEQAETLRQQAAKLGHEWSNHGPTILAAREALAGGDTGEASRLASLAVLMGEQSVLQAKTEAERWREALPE